MPDPSVKLNCRGDRLTGLRVRLLTSLFERDHLLVEQVRLTGCDVICAHRRLQRKAGCPCRS